MEELKTNEGNIDVQLAENKDVEQDFLENEFASKREMLKKTKIVKQSWSIQEIYQKYKSGKLILDPSYQRNYVWNLDKKSAFIESLFMGILIPPIYVVEIPGRSILDENSYEIVDGKQRISTLIAFLNDELKLKEKALEYFGDLFAKKNFSQIKEDYSELISIMLSSVLDIYVITANSSEFTKYDIFARLNRGAEQLKVNEIRKAIYNSHSLDVIDLFVKDNKDSEDYKNIFTANAIKHYNDYGRFYKSISLCINTDLNKCIVNNYNSRPRDMINKTLSDIQNNRISIEDEKVKLICKRTLELFKFFNGENNEFYIFDACIPFSLNNYELLKENITTIKEDQEIQSTLKISPGTTSNVNKRILRIKEILDKKYEY